MKMFMVEEFLKARLFICGRTCVRRWLASTAVNPSLQAAGATSCCLRSKKTPTAAEHAGGARLADQTLFSLFPRALCLGPSTFLIALLVCAAPHAAEQPVQQAITLDTLDAVAPWKALTSDGVTGSVHGARGLEGGALVLQFDLNETAGYAVATRRLPTDLPEDFEISFWMRGEAGRNNFEVKFVDASGDNVWWYRRADFEFSADWHNIRIKRRQIEFAWGPTQQRDLKHFESIEFVVSAGAQGGAGSLWFDRLALKPIERVASTAEPELTASSQQRGNEAAKAMDDSESTAWRSARGTKSPQVLTIDLQQVREFGGLQIDWLKDMQASHYTIELSKDAVHWEVVRTVTAGNGGKDSHLLPESEARWIRLKLLDERRPFAIAEVKIRDLEFGASRNAFIESLAKSARRGCYPRSFVDEQSYWTVVGVAGDSEESLFSEDGAIEIRKGAFSIEPFIRSDDRLLTWADVEIEHSLADGYLPVPTATWRHKDVEMSVTAAAAGSSGNARTEVSYRLRNPTNKQRSFTLALAVRPFQVNPPAQFLNTAGGVSTIHDLQWQEGALRVDGIPNVVSRTEPTAFRAVSVDADTPCEWLLSGHAASTVQDETGLASGAMLFDITLAPQEVQTITLDLLLHPKKDSAKAGDAREVAVAEATRQWREQLNRVQLELPGEAHELFDTLRTSLAHVLINRDGAAIQPGSRAYERSWIRDGAMTSEMLLRLGHAEQAREFLLWYADFQFANGKIPCCVDQRGADPVPENDSQGEFLFLVEQVCVYTQDEKLLRKLWPLVVKAVDYMDRLRLSERTEENQQGERRAFYGLMPASISHEGYSAKPMHSYWDDFWSLAGYEAAVRMARSLGERDVMRRFISSRDQFRSDLYRSLQMVMRTHEIDYLPGAAELGDFDATSTSIALSPVGEQQMLPPDALQATFERYWNDFRERRQDTSWDAYTPYEWRNVGSFLRLGWRDRAWELLDFFLNDRRPRQWNQWAEVIGRQPRKTRFIGDMPHGWVASDFGRSLLDMFAMERPADHTLVIMAGVPLKWLKGEGFAVKHLRTPYGELSYSFRPQGDKYVLDIAEMNMPAGGIAISWPQAPDRASQEILSGSGRWIDAELRVQSLPLKIAFAREAAWRK